MIRRTPSGAVLAIALTLAFTPHAVAQNDIKIG